VQDLHKHADHHMQNDVAEALNSMTLGASFGKDKAGSCTCMLY